MLDYTKAAFGKIVEDFKKFLFIFGIGAQSISIIYLIYALFVSQGILVVNIILLLLSTAYLIFLCVQGVNAENNIRHKLAKRIYTWSKLIIKLYTLAIALYALNFTVDNALSFSVVLTALQLIGWVLQVLFEIISLLLEKLYNLVYTAIQADIEQIKKPMTSVGNFFKKVAGKEIDEPEPPSKTRVFLDNLVQAKKQAKSKPDENDKSQPNPESEDEVAASEEQLPSSDSNPKKRKLPFFKRK